MHALLRFNGATKHDPTIDAWFEARPPELGAIALQWFSRMRLCGDDVRELVHDGCPVACVEDVPFAYVHVFRAHVNLGFLHGSSLRDPHHLLEGTGRFMRHVKLLPGQALDPQALQALLAAAYQDIGARLRGG